MRFIFAFLVTFILSLSSPALAAGPFGIELGKTTANEISAKYKLVSAGTNSLTGGPMYRAQTAKDFNVAELSDILIICDKSGVVLGTILTFPKTKFETLDKFAGETYTLVNKDIPFVGNKMSKYRDEHSEITLNAPHMGFTMEMTYAHDHLVKAFKTQSSEKKKKETAVDKAALFGE